MNTLNPFLVADTELITRRVQRILADAPPFGSPENIAQLQAAQQDAKRWTALALLPTNTLPN
ncbi:hypothetical protein G3A43_07945 [Paraburkholderia aspalathi]|nr:hypothetical protein [Paraburkholderia aspalathi]MBK3780187.1 hypothetical protein [Paraburkholderia aspalathi]